MRDVQAPNKGRGRKGATRRVALLTCFRQRVFDGSEVQSTLMIDTDFEYDLEWRRSEMAFHAGRSLLDQKHLPNAKRARLRWCDEASWA